MGRYSRKYSNSPYRAQLMNGRFGQGQEGADKAMEYVQKVIMDSLDLMVKNPSYPIVVRGVYTHTCGQREIKS